MIGIVRNVLISDYFYIRFSHGFRGIDEVLVSADGEDLCILKEVTSLGSNDLVSIFSYASSILESNRGNFSSVFLVIVVEDVLGDVDHLRRLYSKYKGIPFLVVVDRDLNVHTFYNRFSLSFLLFLYRFKKSLKGYRECKDEDVDISSQEKRNVRRVKDFRFTISHSPPYVTWGILVLNFIFWVLMERAGGSSDPRVLIQYGAKVPPLIWQGQIWRLVTPILLHNGIVHLAINCISLFFVGPILESLLGKGRFAFLYLVSGVMGNLLSLEFSPYFSVGASSSLFGLFGGLVAYAIKYRREIPPKMYYLIVAELTPLIVLNFIIGFVYPRLDNFAHLGGFIGGGLWCWALSSNYPAYNKRVNLLPFLLSGFFCLVLFTEAMVPRDDGYKVYYYIMGSLSFQEGRIAESMGYLENCMSLDPSYENCREVLGRVYAQRGIQLQSSQRIREAFRYYSKALKMLNLERKNYKVLSLIYEKMGVGYAMEKKFSKAVSCFKKAYILNPERKILKREIARQCYIIAKDNLVEGRVYLALRWALESVRYYENSASRFLLFQIYFVMGDFRKAALVPIAEDSLKKKREEIILKNLWYTPHFSYEDLGKCDEIIPFILKADKRGVLELERMIRESPKFVPAYVLLAQRDVLLGRYEKALQYIERAERFKRGSLFLMAVKAEVICLKNPTKAVEMLKGLDEKSPWVYAVLGKAYMEIGNYEEAVKCLKIALRGEPTNPLWRVYIALAYLKKGNKGIFLDEINKAYAYSESQHRTLLSQHIRYLMFHSSEENL